MQWYIRLIIGTLLGLFTILILGSVYIQVRGIPVGEIEYGYGNYIGHNPVNPRGVVYWSFTKRWYEPDLFSRNDIDGAGVYYNEPYSTLYDWDIEYLHRWKYLWKYGEYPKSGFEHDFWHKYLDKD